jgi:hypothetical protein
MKYTYKLTSLITLCLQGAILSATVTVTVTSPSASTSTSPVHFVATATSTAGAITGWDIYSDNNSTPVWRVDSTSLDVWAVLPFGAHPIQVKAFDATGASGSKSFTLTASGTVIPTPPSNAVKKTDLEDDTSVATSHSGWSDCWQPDCSGTSKTNTDTPNQQLLHVANPNPQSPATKDAIEFFIAGDGGDDGLWWYKMGNGLDSLRNYLWDFWFYIPSSSQNIQATEFDFFQYHAGKDASGDPQLQRLMWGTQCDYKASGGPVWDSWNDVVQKWIPAVPNNDNATNTSPTGTPIACKTWTTNQWHHLQYFVQREYDGSLQYGNQTIDGVTTQWNIHAPFHLPPNPCSLSDPNCPVTGVNYQLDLSGSNTTAGTLTEYAELINVTAW